MNSQKQKNSGIRDNHSRGKAGDFLKSLLKGESSLSVVSAYFTIHAYQALKKELDSIQRLRFLFGEPTFVSSVNKDSKESREFRLTETGLKPGNQLKQKKEARECAEWIKDKVDIRSITQKYTDKLSVSILRQREIEPYQTLDRKYIPNNGAPINVLTPPEKLKLLKQVFDMSARVKDVSVVYNGVKPFEKGKGKPPQTSEVLKTKPYVVVKAGKPEGAHWRPLLRGSLIHRYTNLWNNDSWIKYGPWLAAPRKAEIFDAKNKILVRQTGDRIIATLCDDRFVARDNLHIIIPHQIEKIRYILGILNSKLTAQAYEHINPERGEALAQVKKQHVEMLPIPRMSKSKQTVISDIVTQILSKKKDDPSSDTTDLEQRIDDIIFAQLNGVENDEDNTAVQKMYADKYVEKYD